MNILEQKTANLLAEIKGSSTLKTYNKLVQIYKNYKKVYWIAFVIAFAFGFFEVVFTGDTTRLAYILMLIVGSIGIPFAFITGGYHLATGSKLKKLAAKYGMSEDQVASLTTKTLNEGN